MSAGSSSVAISYPSPPPQSNHGSYKYTRVLSQGQTATALNATSQTEILWDLPNRVMNLSRSYLEFDLDIPLPDTVNDHNEIFTLGAPLERFSLYTRSGQYLVDLTNCKTYLRAITPYVSSQSRVASNDKCQSSATEAEAKTDGGRGQFNCMSRNLRSTPADANGRNAQRYDSDAAGTAISAEIDYTENQYFTRGETRVTTEGAVYMRFAVPLSEFHHTLCSVDKDLYFGQSLVLRASVSPLSRIGRATDGTSDARSLSVGTNHLHLKNIRLNLAVETNSAIANGVRNKVMTEGLVQLTPYVYTNLFSGGASQDTISHQARYNSGHGHSLLNVYCATMNSETERARGLDMYNKVVAGVAQKVQSYQASVDNNLLSEYRPDCASGENYILQKEIMEGSMIQNQEVFRYNEVEIFSWRSGKSKDWKATDEVIDGLDLSAERILNVDKSVNQNANGYRNFLWAIIQRRVSIMPNGDVMIQ